MRTKRSPGGDVGVATVLDETVVLMVELEVDVLELVRTVEVVLLSEC
jgi:hypothetical protein